MGKLREMAFPLSVIKSEFHHHRNCLMEYLAKLFLYPDFPQYHHGWMSSVRKGFEDVPKVANTKKFPRKEDVLESIWNNDIDTLEDYYNKGILKDIIFEYNDIPHREKGEYEKFSKFVHKYVEWLAEHIEKNGRVTQDEIEEEISHLWNEEKRREEMKNA